MAIAYNPQTQQYEDEGGSSQGGAASSGRKPQAPSLDSGGNPYPLKPAATTPTVPNPVTTPTTPTTQSVSRDEYRDNWMNRGDVSLDDLKAYIGQYGGTLLSDNGTVRTPYGDTLDMGIGFSNGGRGKAGWTVVGGQGGSTGVGSAMASGSSTAQDPQAAIGASNQNEMARQALLKIMSMDPNSVSASDPAIQSQVTAFRNEQDLARQASRSAAAESLSARGLGQSGALDQEVERGFDTAGRNTGSFAAQLVSKELNDRRSMIMQAINTGIADLNSNEGRQLQRELANIDAALRRQGYDVQRYGIDTQNQQFKDNLGFQIGSSDADREQAAIQFLILHGTGQ